MMLRRGHLYGAPSVVTISLVREDIKEFIHNPRRVLTTRKRRWGQREKGGGRECCTAGASKNHTIVPAHTALIIPLPHQLADKLISHQNTHPTIDLGPGSVLCHLQAGSQ